MKEHGKVETQLGCELIAWSGMCGDTRDKIIVATDCSTQMRV